MFAVPYLFFTGQCREAFTFYKEVFGGEIVAMITGADLPASAQMPEELSSYVMHARLTGPGFTFMGGDAPPDRYTKPGGYYVSLITATAEEADQLYSALSDGGDIFLPIEETFFAKKFAMFADRFGTRWMLNCEKPMG